MRQQEEEQELGGNSEEKVNSRHLGRMSLVGDKMGEHASKGRKPGKQKSHKQRMKENRATNPLCRGQRSESRLSLENSISGSANRISRQRAMEGDDDKLTIH